MVRYVTLAAAICIALSPALFFTFGYHNDYNAFGYDSSKCCMGHPETGILIAIGRYAAALAQNLQNLTINDVGDFWAWRLIGVLSTAGLACYYLYIVSLEGKPEWRDVWLAVAVFTLPTMQFQALWISMWTMWSPPMLLALAAAHLLLKATGEQDRQRIALLAAAGFAALLIGMLFYPASVIFVLAPAAHLLVTRSSVRMRWLAVAVTVALGSAIVGIFVFHKLIVLPNLSNVPYLGEYEFKLAGDLIGTIVHRLGRYLSISSYLWLGVVIPWFPILVAIAAGAGAVFWLLRTVSGGMDRNVSIDALMAASLFGVAAAPLVLVSQFSQTFRITFTMAAIFLLVFYWLLTQLPLLRSARTGLAAGLAAAGGVACFASVYSVASNAAAEHALYAKALASLPTDKFHSIIVLRPNRTRQAFGYHLRQEFGGLGPIDHIADLLIGRRHKGKARFDVATLHVEPGTSAPVVMEKDAVIIDTSPIYSSPGLKATAASGGFVSARPRGTIGPMNAVDGNGITFWEVCGKPFPIEIEIDLPSQRTVKGYSLSTVEEMARMPNNWEVLITSDGQNWRPVHRMKGGGWKQRELRRYEIAPTTGVKGIKLVIQGVERGICMRLYEFALVFAK